MRSTSKLALDRTLFSTGERIALAVSGGADSVALLRAMLDVALETGLVLRVVHVHHNLRETAADADAAFVRELAQGHNLPFELAHVDTPARISRTGESVEQAARLLRYEAFQALLREGQVDAVATAHTLDDQAETVLMKFMRGAWTEGLSGIHPTLRIDGTTGRIIRPLLNTHRSEIESYLRSLDQPWREDATNSDTTFTRNRVRHSLLPVLRRDYNPGIDRQLAHLAVLARDEEARWQAELARVLPSLLLPGNATRGGGRSTSTLAEQRSVSLEVPRLRTLDPALRRRVVRAAAEHIGASLDFAGTEDILDLCLNPDIRSNAKRTLAAGLLAERTPREIRLILTAPSDHAGLPPIYTLPVPGEVRAPAFNLLITARADASGLDPAQVRAWQPGDRVTLAHSSGPKKVKEVLARMKVSGVERTNWPVVVWRGEILWMRNATVAAPPAGHPTITASPM